MFVGVLVGPCLWGSGEYWLRRCWQQVRLLEDVRTLHERLAVQNRLWRS